MSGLVIVGGGPAGAALAYLLARNGVRTTLVERHADFAREFRGEGLQPSGVECLMQMGLADALATVPQTRIARVAYGLGGKVVDVPLELSELEQIRLVSQPDLLAMLTREAARSPSFELRMGATVRELERDASGRVTGVRLAGGELLAADLVIATDGRNSVVRKRLGLELEQIEQPFDVLWSRGPLVGPLARPDGAFVEFLVGGGVASIFPAPAGGHQIGVIIRKGGFRALRDAGPTFTAPPRWSSEPAFLPPHRGYAAPAFTAPPRWSSEPAFLPPHRGYAGAGHLDWLRGRCRPELWAMIDRARDRLERPVLLDVVCGRLPRWSVQGVLLIGDAAHPMSPVGGQGINMALRDAVVAANHLVAALRDGADPEGLDRAAANVEAERSPEIVAIQALQTKRGRSFDRTPGRLQLRVMAWMLSRRSLVRMLMRQRAPFGHGLADVALRV